MLRVFFTGMKRSGAALSIAAAARGSGIFIFPCQGLLLPSLPPFWAARECRVPATKGALHADTYVYFCKWFQKNDEGVANGSEQRWEKATKEKTL